MAAKTCARCGGKKAHASHSRWSPDFHAFQDASRAGLQSVSEARRAYQQSEAHKAAYASLEGVCMAEAAGAPGACHGELTPHHTMPRSQAGGLERADEYPVVALCAWHNTWVQEGGREWARTHTFHRNGQDHFFLISR